MTVNRVRGKVKEVITTITGDLDGSIGDAIKYLQKYQSDYPNAMISYEDIAGSYDPNECYGLSIYHYVPETDEQMAQRIAREEKIAADREKHERAQLAILAAKYPNQ
jgi:hypothetical protein